MRQIFQHHLVGAAEGALAFIFVLVVKHGRHITVHHDIVFGVEVQRLAVFEFHFNVGHLTLVVHLIRIGAARAIDGASISDETRLHQVENFLSAE